MRLAAQVRALGAAARVGMPRDSAEQRVPVGWLGRPLVTAGAQDGSIAAADERREALVGEGVWL